MHQFLAVFAAGAILSLVAATLLADLVGRLRFPLPPVHRRIGCIDGLRGYLALSVMVHHFYIWIQSTRLGGEWASPDVNFLNQLGAGGVALFFMVTGLVFYPRVLIGLRATDWSAVYITRVFRIVPLVAFSFVCITIIVIARTGAKFDSSYGPAAIAWISSWGQPPVLGYDDTGRMNAYVLWSLWYEWLFYLFVLPLLAGAMDVARAIKWPTWSVPIAFLAATLIIRLAAVVLDFKFNPIRYLPLFAVGMLAFECQAMPAVRKVLASSTASVLAAAALLAGMIFTDTPYRASLPLFAFFFVCVACGNSFWGVLKTRGALVLGECSFGIYLLHGIVLDLAFVGLGGLPSTMALPWILPGLMAVVVIATAATYLIVERPSMRVGKQIAQRLSGWRRGFPLERASAR